MTPGEDSFGLREVGSIFAKLISAVVGEIGDEGEEWDVMLSGAKVMMPFGVDLSG